jgi:hypothetical protein
MLSFVKTEAGYDCDASGIHGIDDFVCGELRFGGPEEFWFFWPKSEQPLSCGQLRRISRKLSELNTGVPES